MLLECQTPDTSTRLKTAHSNPNWYWKAYQFMICFCIGSQRSPATGLEYLLGLDGNIEVQNDAGYWVKMEVSSVAVTAERPHGIRYSLTLHAPDNTRLIGFDNAHCVR